MVHDKQRSIFIALVALLFIQTSFAQDIQKNDGDVIESGIRILRTYFLEDTNWKITDPFVKEDISGLIHHLEDAPLDSILHNLDKKRHLDTLYVFRSPEDVEDSLRVPGYIAAPEVQRNIEQIGVGLQNEVQQNPIPVPDQVIENARMTAPLVPEGKGMVLFADSLYTLPDSLIIPEVIPDSILNTPEQFQRLVRIDSMRNVYIEDKRLEYNDSITSATIEKASAEYRRSMFEQQLMFRTKRYKDEVTLHNYRVLRAYNDSVMANVNDTIQAVIDVLTAYADFMDTARISITNLKGESQEIVLQNGREHFSRVWLKNEQNDSLQVLVKSTDKRGMQMLINDGVTFHRFSERQTKDFDFESLKGDYSGFSDVGKAYEVETPWRIGGDGSVGFTQTYYENWKKGGESAISLLMILKGFANYESADGKIKWDNNAEIRNGWLQPGGKGSELKKNDDKLELTSRFGLRAAKKWYYSAEFNFNTQFFRGYNYPKSEYPDPISAFLSPAKTYFKVGMDYKPNADFSLFLSPFSVKNVFVKDTALIDQTKFGVEQNKRAFWEPGLNAEFRYKTNLTSDILWETKYKMFVNYKDPFRKLDIDWENNLRMRLTTYIDLKLMLHLIYDDDVLFPIYDDNDNKIGEKPKLQIKEFITVGFSYSINKKVMRTKRIR